MENIAMKLTEPLVFIRLAQNLPGQSRQVDADEMAARKDMAPSRLKAAAQLFSGKAFAEIKALDRAVRAQLKKVAIAIPSSPFKGSYPITRKTMEQALAILEKGKTDRAALVIAFLTDDYDAECERAKTEMGAEYDPSDYPPAEDIKGEFRTDWTFFSLDAPEDMPESIRQAEQARFAGMIDQVGEECRQALRETLGKLVTHLVDRLRPGDDGKAKKLYASAVESLREFLDTIGARDITSDTAIRELSDKAKAIIGANTADDLKSSKYLATKVRDGLAAVAVELDKLVKTEGARAFDFADDDTPAAAAVAA
jgi:hypothetical protein